MYRKVPIPTALREAVLKRDGYHCQSCGNWRDLAVDHVIAEWRGGPTEEWNLQAMCRSCNSRKGRSAIGHFWRPGGTIHLLTGGTWVTWSESDVPAALRAIGRRYVRLCGIIRGAHWQSICKRIALDMYCMADAYARGEEPPPGVVRGTHYPSDHQPRCLSAGRGCVNRVPPDVDYCPDCELEGWHNHRGAR